MTDDNIVDDYLVGYSDGLKPIAEAAEQVIIAYGMGWDMDGVIERLRASLPTDSVCRVTPTPQKSSMTNDNEWQRRVLAERDGLSGKIDRLVAFMQGDAIKRIPREDALLLMEQSYAMRKYLHVLNRRIARF